MAVIRLDKSKTALLMADFHADGMEQNPMVKEQRTLERAGEVLAAARDAGVFVAYIVVNFRPGFPKFRIATRLSAPEKPLAQRLQLYSVSHEYS